MLRSEQMPATRPLITTREAASLRGVSVWTIHRWHKKGMRAAMILQPGNRLVFERSVVEAFDPDAPGTPTPDGAA